MKDPNINQSKAELNKCTMGTSRRLWPLGAMVSCLLQRHVTDAWVFVVGNINEQGTRRGLTTRRRFRHIRKASSVDPSLLSVL